MSGYVAGEVWAPVAPAVDARRRETCLDSGVGGILGAEPRRIGDGLGCEATPGPRIPSLETSKGRSLTMLWTILVILVIVALAIFIFKRVRG